MLKQSSQDLKLNQFNINQYFFKSQCIRNTHIINLKYEKQKKQFSYYV